MAYILFKIVLFNLKNVSSGLKCSKFEKNAIFRDFQHFPNLKFSIIVEETYPIVLIFSGFHPGIHCNKKISQSQDNFANEKPLPVFFVKSENMTSCSKKKCLRYTILYYIKT